jgi:hypothetical protein
MGYLDFVAKIHTVVRKKKKEKKVVGERFYLISEAV